MAGPLAGKLLAAALALCGTVIATPTGEEQVVFKTDADLTRVYEELQKAEVIPTVIYDFQPIFGLSAEWDSSHAADLGNTLKPGDLQSAPTVSLVKASTSVGVQIATNYVLTLTDPDAPSRDNPKWSEFCHWIATGLSSDIKLALKDVVEYKPPAPPAKTGKHRYVFLVWVPANGTTEKLNLSKPEERKHWGGEQGRGVRDWAMENGLVPVAANFIYAQNEKQ